MLTLAVAVAPPAPVQVKVYFHAEAAEYDAGLISFGETDP